MSEVGMFFTVCAVMILIAGIIVIDLLYENKNKKKE